MHLLPLFLQQLDICNYFGRLAIWILLGTIFSIYSESPIRASINVFCFFISMVTSYYLYCHSVLGFLPFGYMMIWILLSFVSLILAYICLYAKREGPVALQLQVLLWTYY